MTPTWTHAIVCLDSVDFEWCPSPRQRTDLVKLGLGERRVKIPVGSTASEVHEQLLDEYPKLSEGGGYEICRAYHGSRRLHAISCPNEGYSQRYLSIEAGQAKLYIRPLQNNLERTPDVTVTAPSDMAGTITAINNAPKEVCGKCKVEIPFSLLRNHIETCTGLEIEDIEDDDEDTDRNTIPVQISSPERSTGTARTMQTSSVERGNQSDQSQDLISA
ncbi:uncharacterized protein [Ptychodera flava]|uniref:uncharacterized protein n=1 Tax=Ptychodera flava TaxID=63121 RepID=UPI00396A1FC3